MRKYVKYIYPYDLRYYSIAGVIIYETDLFETTPEEKMHIVLAHPDKAMPRIKLMFRYKGATSRLSSISISDKNVQLAPHAHQLVGNYGYQFTKEFFK